MISSLDFLELKVFAFSFPSCISCFLYSSLWKIVSIAVKTSSVFAGETNIPAPERISGIEEILEAITGVLECIASNTGRPKPS